MSLGIAAVQRPLLIIGDEGDGRDRAGIDDKAVVVLTHDGLPECVPSMLPHHISRNERHQGKRRHEERRLLLQIAESLKSGVLLRIEALSLKTE